MPGIWALAVVVLVVASSLGLLALISPAFASPAGPGGASRSSSAAPAGATFTHGDLIVGPGQTFIIQPGTAGPTYYQGGNITVEAGGTLDVYNVTLSFVEFVGTTGTAAQKLSHILTFQDEGTVNFYDANLTTDVQVINAYAKLNLTVTGTLNAWGSTFAFPGWIYLDGGSADMTLNQSTITWNLAVSSLLEPGPIFGDTLWAPEIEVVGGARMTLLQSQIEHVYADNTVVDGYARPAPLTYVSPPAGVLISNPNSNSFQVNTGGTPENLTQDYLYPAAGAQSGYAAVGYGASVVLSTVAISAVYAGNSYQLTSSATFPADSVGVVEVPFTAGLLGAITATGMLGFINNTGDFGTPGAIDITVAVSAGTANVTSTTFQLNTTGPTYDDLVTGTGSVFSAINSGLGFNWNPYNATPGSAYSQLLPYPWNSNKLDFIDGAAGYLANITTPGAALPGVYGSSAILPDASSQVYFYRWAQFNLTGRGGVLPIEGASLSAYYAYNSSQANNATTATLNRLATAVHDLWGYVQYFDAQNGVLSYGTTNAAGQGFLLLASGGLNGTDLPDGNYMTTYHVGITVPAVGVKSHWFNASLTPYPSGVAASSPHYNGPDYQPPQGFPDYYGAVTIYSAQLLANGVATTAVLLGQTLGVKVVFNDSGTATITQALAQLYYNASLTPSSLLAESETTTLDMTTIGQSASLMLSWVSNDTVVGLHGFDYLHNLTLAFEWNYGIPSLAGGSFAKLVPTVFDPSQIAITSFVPPPTTLDLTTTSAYFSSGTIVYNGSQAATIYLYAIPVGGGTPILIGGSSARSGPFSLPLYALQGVLSPGASYTLSVVATYNGRSAYDNITTETFTVPKSPSSPTNFLFQTFLGLPLWVWIAIAAAAAVAIVAFLLITRRQAAGKLVECGECGNLIPEDATVCPKCGAEFESDLIRCSRCASTIPADSKFCPECAAQLLGKPGEAESDPEKQAYADFTGKYRAEAKRELGDNYTEGAFWDWWKRQPTYTPFSQWSLQQGQGTARAGMTAPPTGTEMAPETPTPKQPPKGGATPPPGWAEAGGAAAGAPKAPPPAAPTTTPPPTPPSAGGLKACPSCGKEIPAEYLVCPFCNAVTQ